MALYTIDPAEVRALEGCITRNVVLNEASQVGRAVYFVDDHTVAETDGADLNKVIGNIGFIVSGAKHTPGGTVAAQERATVAMIGPVFVGEDAALDLTKAIFLADEDTSVSGLLADTDGTVTRRVGAPLAADTLFWNGVDTSPPTS